MNSLKVTYVSTKCKLINAGFTSGCLCPGDTLLYECTVMGYGTTVWTGSAFNCRSSNNDIILLHNRFNNGTDGTCTNGAIVGRSIAVDGNNYTSQLNVTITSDTAGKTIKCIHDRWTHNILVFTSIIPG